MAPDIPETRMPDTMTDTTVPARDGYPLAATIFAPDRPARAAVLLSSATAVPRKIYRGFAAYLAERDFAVLTFDYRGVAGSRPVSLVGFPARMRDWATLDTSAALEHMRARWPGTPVAMVGHSFGGQALGLLANNAEISRALLIAAQAGYWRLFRWPESYRVVALMSLGRLITRAFGYTPGWTGIGEDLPKGVFLEWAGWVMSERYFLDDPTLPERANFSRYRGALCAVGIDDDPWTTPPAVDLLLSAFTGTRPQRRRIDPRAFGADPTGHFGFFRPVHRDTLWREAADWLAGEQT
jgi:predicted alpha/beta hydrolase